MSWIRFGAGFLLLVAAAIPLAWACARFTRAAVDADRPVLRWAVGVFAAVLGIVLSGQVLGIVGFYSRIPLLLATWVVAALLWLGARSVDGRHPFAAAEVAATGVRSPSTAESAEVTQGGDRDWFRVLLWAVVVGICVTAFATSVLKQSYGPDAVNYHLPDIANWVRDHGFWSVRQFQLGVYQNAYPMNSEVVSGFFVVPFGHDYLVNLGVLLQFALVTVAVGALAEHFGARRRSDALLVGLAAATIPVVATSHLGSVGSDVIPIAAVVLAVLGADRWRRTEAPADLALAALALGLAFGTKFTTIVYVPVLAMSLVVLAVWRRRWVQGLVLVPLLFALPCAYWFVRNVVAEGNPLWAFPLLGLPGGFLRDTADSDSIVEWFSQGGLAAVIRTGVVYALEGLGAFALVVAGIRALWRAVRGDLTRIWFVLVAPLLAVPLLWSQAWTSGVDGYNMPATARYVGATLAVLLAVSMGEALGGLRAQRWRWAILAAVTVDAAVTFLAPTFPSLRVSFLALGLGILAGVAVLAVLVISTRGGHPQPNRTRRGILVTGTCVSAVVLVVLAAQRWDGRWYRDVNQPNLAQLDRAVQDLPLEGDRIAVAGIFHAYPLYGKDFSNEVVFVGDGDMVEPWEPGEADAWLAAVRAACADYVAVQDDEEHWLHPIPELDFVEQLEGHGLERVMAVGAAGDARNPRVGLYRVVGTCT